MVVALSTYDYLDPSALIAELARRQLLREGETRFVLVERPSTLQRLVCIEQLPVSSDVDHYLAVRDVLRAAVESLPLPEQRPPVHSVLTILVRRCLAVFGPGEAQWFLAWRYSNHLCSTFDGDVIVVTEHGWTNFCTRWGGSTPHLSLADQAC